MKYNEIIGLNDYFQPIYDLENEIGTYWKQFIPNEKFYRVLSETINSLESSKPDEKKSIWLQGAYGTGKSHATAVVKHLLFDDLDEINDFIENLEEQIKFKIKHFRKTKRVFPVVLKGTSSVVDNRTFALVLEKAVKNALKKKGIELITKTDFDKMIEKLNSIRWEFWEDCFKGTELEFYGTKQDIIFKLQRNDISLSTKRENILSQKGIHFSTENIAKWLVEVRNELKNKGIADHLVIYWDEFTGILELPKSGLLLTELQNIAELSINKGVYLFVVAHRKPYRTNISRDDVEKVLGRFKVLDYSMEPITTYHIISAAIRKKDIDKFTEVKDKCIYSVKSLIEKIAISEGVQVKKSLEGLFPIHPYTAYLATFIARNIGSTERSIFNFLYDERSGFKKFIKENPGENGKIFLTADYLWDFFYEEFERMESEKVHAVLEKYKLHKDTLEEKGDKYLSVFKGILLLNLLYRFVEVGESSLVVPSEKNIMALFAGAIDQKDLTAILLFIDDKQVINKTPDNLYLITSSGLPSREVETEKNKIKSEYNTIGRILNNKQEKELQDTISASVNRDVEFIIIDASLNGHLIRRKLEKAYKKDYTIHLCLFLGKSDQELQQIKNILKYISNDDLRNIIFVVSEVILDDKTFNRFVEYKARAIVADKHNYPEERNINEEYARKIIDDWINQVKSGYIEWFLQDENGKELMNQFSRKINEELSKKIFSYGLENIDGTQKNRNIWTYKRSKTSAEIFLFANSREDVEEKTSKGPERYLREIIKDNNGEYIVDINLKIKDDISGNHPLKKMHLKIREIFEKEKNSGVFNLGDALRFLTKPPYGLYPNMVNMAAVGFLMREYIGKLFEAGTGIPIKKEVMRDKILTLFDYWEKGTHGRKLDVRFKTEDEEKLTEILKDLFKLKDIISLINARWKVREWVKSQGFPIWVFKFAENINENTKRAIDAIFELVQSVDRELTYEKVRDYLNAIEGVKYDLDILIDRENPKELFKKWLKSIEGVEISSRDIEEVINYIRKNMQEEVASWTEDKVREKVKDWYMGKLKKQLGGAEQLMGSNGIIAQGNRITVSQYTESYPFVLEEKIENIKKRILGSSEKNVKEILIKLIDELKDKYPSILETIEKYLEGI